MRKTKLFCLLLFALFYSLNPLCVSSKSAVATADNPQIGYGILLFDQNAEVNRLVSFQMPEVSSFETVYDLGYSYYSAGACVDGTYYLTSVGPVSNAAERLMAIDMETRKMSVVGSFSGLPYKFADITYDYSTDTMYGIVGSLVSAKPLILLAFCRYRYHTSLLNRPPLPLKPKLRMPVNSYPGFAILPVSIHGSPSPNRKR